MKTLRFGLLLAAVGPAGTVLGATACGGILTNLALVEFDSGGPCYTPYQVSYTATSALPILCTPVVAAKKFVSPSTQAPGGTVTFTICLENQPFAADSSIWNIIITDPLPQNASYVGASYAGFNTTGPGAVTAIMNSSSLAGPWTPAQPAGGQTAPSILRWIVSVIAPARSACVSYMVTIQ